MAEPPERCQYCGAELDPRYYFCTACATPYVTEEAVLPPVYRIRPTTGQRIAQKAPQVKRLFWTYFVVVLGGAAVSQIFLGKDLPGVTLLFLDTLMVVTTVFFAVAYWPSLRPQLKRVGFDRWEAWVGLAALVPVLALNYGYHGWLRDVVGAGGTTLIEELKAAGIGDAALVMSIGVVPAITEEIAFRGLVQHWLQTAVPPLTAIGLAAALFTALHFSILSAPILFLMGLLLGWLKWRTGSLWPPIVVHFLHNVVVLAYLEG